MNRTQWVAMMVRCVVCALVSASALGSEGCSCAVAHEVADASLQCGDVGGALCRDATLVTDPITPLTDPHPPQHDPDYTPCGGTGRVGGHCRDGTCASPLMCANFATPVSIEMAFGVPLAQRTDAMHPGYSLVDNPADPTRQAPFNAFEGSLCLQQCDTSAMADMCGACTSCSNLLTQAPFVAALGGARAAIAMPMYGATTGICRVDCTWTATTRGSECADDGACDTFGSVCIEACTSDDECNTLQAATYDGQLVATLETAHPQTCNRTTGRCEYAGHAGAAVGDRCASGDDCAPGTGVCLAGGLCGEFGCATSGTLCGTNGLCLITDGTTHPQTLCLRGCRSPADCGPGNSCQSLMATIGTFTGYCIGICTDDSECSATETCTDTVDAGGAVQRGTCVPRCMPVGAIGSAAGCADTEFCRVDHDGATHGFCRSLDQFCGAANTFSLPAASTDCATGWVCDELAARGTLGREVFADGHCVPACASDADCTAPSTCVTTGPLAGLCRAVCASDPDCASPQVCDATLGRCVEARRPPPR